MDLLHEDCISFGVVSLWVRVGDEHRAPVSAIFIIRSWTILRSSIEDATLLWLEKWMLNLYKVAKRSRTLMLRSDWFTIALTRDGLAEVPDEKSNLTAFSRG